MHVDLGLGQACAPELHTCVFEQEAGLGLDSLFLGLDLEKVPYIGVEGSKTRCDASDQLLVDVGRFDRSGVLGT